MRLTYCDLCNESVSEEELAAGTATRVGNRVTCAACHRSMNAGAGGPGQQAAAAPAAEGHHPPKARRRRPPLDLGQALGTLAILLAALVAIALLIQINSVESGMERALAKSDRRIEDLGRVIHGLEARVGGRIEEAAQGLLAAQRRRDSERAAAVPPPSRDPLDRIPIEVLERRLDSFQAENERLSEEVRRLQAQRYRDGGAPAPKAEASGSAAKPESKPAATGALNSEDPRVRLRALYELEGRATRADLPAVLGLLEDPLSVIRVTALRILDQLGEQEAIPALIDRLSDQDAEVRALAVATLRGIAGQALAYDPEGSLGSRKQQQQAWREWWERSWKTLRFEVEGD